MKKLTDQQIERSMSFARGTMALAGHTADHREAEEDARKVLAGEMSYDDAFDRILERHR